MFAGKVANIIHYVTENHHKFRWRSTYKSQMIVGIWESHVLERQGNVLFAIKTLALLLTSISLACSY